MPTRQRRLREEGMIPPREPRDFDAMLPSQLLHANPITPEQALMLAIVERSIQDLSVRPGALNRQEYERGRNGHGVNPELWEPTPRETAIEWFASDEADWIFSFRNICDVFGWDVGRARAELLPGRAA